MKVIIHGATNGSNFGDYLFADIFWKKLNEYNVNGNNIFLEFPKYGIGNFFRDGLDYTHKQTLQEVLNSDMLVYMSGGYFGERKNTLKESLKRFIRYMPIGLLFALRKRPILILGVGGGPITNKLLRKSMSFVMNRAKIVTVRDQETANYYKSYGVTNDIKVTSDTAQVITQDMLPRLDKTVKCSIDELFIDKKIIFLHALGSNKGDTLISEKIIPSLNEFLKVHKEYGVIIGTDEIYSSSIKELKTYTDLNCENVYYYKYENPWQLCSLLKEVDMLITTKLHVGIIGATLSKSVLSFPVHSEKTKRYYKQIGETDRCVSITNLETETVDFMLESFHNKKIKLSKDIIAAANKNLEILKQAIKS